MITVSRSLPQDISADFKEVFIMTKKLVIVAGIIGLAAMAAAAVAFFLTKNKTIAEALDCEDDDEI